MAALPSLPPTPREWQRALRAQHDGGLVVHVCGDVEDAPRIAGAAWPLARTGAFDQVVLDAGTRPGAERELRELDASASVRRLDRTRGLGEAIGAELAELACLAVVVHADDEAALHAAIAASRRGISLVRVGPLDAGGGVARAIRRLADLLLVDAEHDPDRLRSPERVHAVGNPLIDAVRRCSREAVARAEWKRLDAQPRRFVLAVLSGPAALSRHAGALDRLAARVPLVIEAPSGARIAGATHVGRLGFVARLSLERAAGAIVTDSRRVEEESAVLGIRCHRLGDAALAEIQPEENAPTPSVIPLSDGRAGARAAEVLVANFARVRAV
jgi:hypothetical protein